MAGYTRNDTQNNIADGNVINADDLDGEFNSIETAFGAASGHKHNGTTGEGAPIVVFGPNQEFLADTTAFFPKADNTYDFGKVGARFKDVYFAGTFNSDNILSVDTTVSGTLTTGNISGVVYVDSVNNRVGINDATPSVALDVTGVINATGGFTGNLTGNVTGNADTATTLIDLTASATELNTLDGVVNVTSTQINFLDGLTQNVQDALNALQSGVDPTVQLELDKLFTNSAGSSQPATTYANMWWYDTLGNTLNLRTEGDDGWIRVGYFEQDATPEFAIFDNTKLVDTSGIQRGLLGGQDLSIWQDGTGSTESLVSPAQVRARADASASAAVAAAITTQTVSQWNTGTSDVEALISPSKLYQAVDAYLPFLFSVSLIPNDSISATKFQSTSTEIAWVKAAAGSQDISAWQTGSSSTESLVSPSKIAAAITALAPSSGTLTSTTWNAGLSTTEALISPSKLAGAISAQALTSVTNASIPNNEIGAEKFQTGATEVTWVKDRAGSQLTSAWEAGTGTTQSLVSPANVKSAIDALAPAPSVLSQATWDQGTATTEATISPLKLRNVVQPAGVLASDPTTAAVDLDLPTNANPVEVSLSFSFVSLSGNDDLLIQLFRDGSLVTSGYTSNASLILGTSITHNSRSDGFLVRISDNTKFASGVITLQKMPSTNIWTYGYNLGFASGSSFGGGTANISGTNLTGIRVKSVSGATFDQGSVYIRYT